MYRPSRLQEQAFLSEPNHLARQDRSARQPYYKNDLPTPKPSRCRNTAKGKELPLKIRLARLWDLLFLSHWRHTKPPFQPYSAISLATLLIDE